MRSLEFGGPGVRHDQWEAVVLLPEKRYFSCWTPPQLTRSVWMITIMHAIQTIPIPWPPHDAESTKSVTNNSLGVLHLDRAKKAFRSTLRRGHIDGYIVWLLCDTTTAWYARLWPLLRSSCVPPLFCLLSPPAPRNPQKCLNGKKCYTLLGGLYREPKKPSLR